MRSVLRALLLLLLTGCAVPQSQAASLPYSTQQTKLPEFVNDPKPGINEDLAKALKEII